MTDYKGVRGELNRALVHLVRVALLMERGPAVREHVDLARTQVLSALIEVSKQEQKVLREILAAAAEAEESDP